MIGMERTVCCGGGHCGCVFFCFVAVYASIGTVDWFVVDKSGDGRVAIGRGEANATGSCWADHVNFCLVTEARLSDFLDVTMPIFSVSGDGLDPASRPEPRSCGASDMST